MNQLMAILGVSLVAWASYRLGYKRAILYAVNLAEKEYAQRFAEDKARLLDLFNKQVEQTQQAYDARTQQVIDTAQAELARIREVTIAEVEKLRQQVNQNPLS